MLADCIGELVTYAVSKGVIIGIEPHVSSALDSVDKTLWLLSAVGSPNLMVHFDISHFEVQGIPMEGPISSLAPIAIHTHVKDERGIAPNHEFLIPGEGEFDYERYLKLMRRAGYEGYITAEVSLMVQRRPDYDALDAATQTYDVLNRAFTATRTSRA